MELRKVWQIVKWEFSRYAFTKGWFFSLFLIPVMLFYVFHLPVLVKEDPYNGTKYLIGVIDTTPEQKLKFSPPDDPNGINQQILFVRLQNPHRSTDSSLNLGFQMLRMRQLDGLVMISENTVHPITLFAQSFPDELFYSLLQAELVKAQISAVGIDKKDTLNEIVVIPEIKIIRFDEHKFPHEFNTEAALKSVTNYSLLFFLALSFIAGTVIRSFQEEKSNRLIEVLLSSARIRELTIGKYISFLLLAVIQTGVWIAITWYLGSHYKVSEMHTEEMLGMAACFCTGLLFYVALYLYIGSRIFKESSTQFMLTFLSLVIFFPMLFSQHLLFNGDNTIVARLGFIPFFTPATSMMLISAKNFDLIVLIQQNVLLLVWSVIFLMPMLKSHYNPFGMFGETSKKPDPQKDV